MEVLIGLLLMFFGVFATPIIIIALVIIDKKNKKNNEIKAKEAEKKKEEENKRKEEENKRKEYAKKLVEDKKAAGERLNLTDVEKIVKLNLSLDDVDAELITNVILSMKQKYPEYRYIEHIERGEEIFADYLCHPRIIDIAKKFSSRFINDAKYIRRNGDYKIKHFKYYSEITCGRKGVGSKYGKYIDCIKENVALFNSSEVYVLLFVIALYAEVMIRSNLKAEIEKPNNELMISYHMSTSDIDGFICWAEFYYTVPNLDYIPPKKF